MILISHRGNINGKNELLENSPFYIDDAIDAGYDVEVDLRAIEGCFYLGHDENTFGITLQWLNERKDSLWIHCKNLEAIEWFSMIKSFNYFWHEEDKVTLTSKGYVWAYPGNQPIKNSIAVLPEIHNDNIKSCVGICSDFIESFKS